jgi:glycine cleavage system H protein
MKDIKALNLPENIRYSKDHEWARREGDNFVIGIDDYAQDQLGDIVFVELPEVGKHIEKEGEFGTVESVKAVSELFMPLGGEIVEINSNLENEPELVNKDPYGAGWMLKIKASSPADFDKLMDRKAYLSMLHG